MPTIHLMGNSRMAMFFQRFVLYVALVSAVPLAFPQASTVAFVESGFPAVDSLSISQAALLQGFVGARVVGVAGLGGALDDQGTKLLVLAYGSAYPEDAWPAILRFLERGGNLIVLGGKPFTRAVYREGAGWRVRDESLAASRELLISGYQETQGSELLKFASNRDIQPQQEAFSWRRAFSPVIRLSEEPLEPAVLGTSGYPDAEISALGWGTKDGRKMAAPAVVVDHEHHRFAGGRWVLLTCEPEPGAFADSKLLNQLGALALRKHDRFTLRPRVPLYLPGEPVELKLEMGDGAGAEPGDELEVEVHSDEPGKVWKKRIAADESTPLTLTPEESGAGKGLHVVDGTLLRGGKPIWRYHSGYWIRDWQYLLSGPRLTTGKDYFELNGKTLPVVGTTYMASDVDRQYLSLPNAYIWDQDMAAIQEAGINMIRSGMWCGWKGLTGADGAFTEDALRSIEAFLMTARRHELPVQFTLFAFLPESFGGDHPYLDPVSLEAQDRYVRSISERFHALPFLAWDLINEPSANGNIWRTLPQRNPHELGAWKRWLKARYPDEGALRLGWDEPENSAGRQGQTLTTAKTSAAADALYALPAAADFDADGARSGANPLKVYDYFLFTQSFFADWASRQRGTIRATGSAQGITVGQDEGGTYGRVSPAFFLPAVDFTSIHTWWDWDAILWASLAAKMPGKPMLVQEMGEQRRLMQDGSLRFDAKEEALELERKMALAFVRGAGGIEWVWDVNARMANDNEITIGAIRPDGTWKPEAEVLAGFARFAKDAAPWLDETAEPEITIVPSQELQYSVFNGIAVAAQKQSVRALAYLDHSPARMLPENELAELGNPKLVILEAPQALSEGGWQQLRKYAEGGGTLLITGPVNRDEHWRKVDRFAELGVRGTVIPLATRQSELVLPDGQSTIEVSFGATAQQAPFETIRFEDHSSVKVVRVGKGTIVWTADPVEFADGAEASAKLYAFAMRLAGVELPFRAIRPLSSGVAAIPTVLKNAVLYSFASDSFRDEPIDLVDAGTGTRIRFTLRAQHGALLLIRKGDGKVVASYGTGQTELK